MGQASVMFQTLAKRIWRRQEKDVEEIKGAVVRLSEQATAAEGRLDAAEVSTAMLRNNLEQLWAMQQDGVESPLEVPKLEVLCEQVAGLQMKMQDQSSEYGGDTGVH